MNNTILCIFPFLNKAEIILWVMHTCVCIKARKIIHENINSICLWVEGLPVLLKYYFFIFSKFDSMCMLFFHNDQKRKIFWNMEIVDSPGLD
jgi:hypothetical protein